MNKINIFYHVCLINNGFTIAAEQLHLLSISGLLHNSNSLNIGLLYDSEKNRDEFLHLVNTYNIDSNINFLYKEVNSNQWEQDTAIGFKKHSDSVQDDEYIFYFHNKGPTRYKTSGELGSRYWRQYLEYHTILKWKDCITKLDDGNESCGTQWLDGFYGGHYSGTFYWMNTSLIKRIPIEYFYNTSKHTRFCVEALPGVIEHKHFSFQTINEDLYSYTIHPNEYTEN
jgi:hypothetical protein